MISTSKNDNLKNTKQKVNTKFKSEFKIILIFTYKTVENKKLSMWYMLKKILLQKHKAIHRYIKIYIILGI